MHSFFVTKKQLNQFVIEGKDLHHLKNVVKLKPAEEVFCIFEAKKYLCEIIEITEGYCLVEVKQEAPVLAKSVEINLFAGIIREQKWDFVLQKATELGVTRIIPVAFSRNVVVIDQKKAATKISRWQAICLEAAKQSKRTSIPRVENIIQNLVELKNFQADLKLVAWENEANQNLKNHLQTNFTSVNIIIGPEGGLTNQEVKTLTEMGYQSVSLGANILRAETASLYLISAINYEKN